MNEKLLFYCPKKRKKIAYCIDGYDENCEVGMCEYWDMIEKRCTYENGKSNRWLHMD